MYLVKHSLRRDIEYKKDTLVAYEQKSVMISVRTNPHQRPYTSTFLVLFYSYVVCRVV